MYLSYTTPGARDPGAMANDALVRREIGGKWRTVAGIRDVDQTRGIYYGTPVWRSDEDREFYRGAYRLMITVLITLCLPGGYEETGYFRIVSCDDDELAFKRVGD